ncbi:MAG: hypothetical protein KDH20_01855 [Rhodocyclaceae bacterium]|nr:hypothetical protein [Rhodocyclaceae bacterium]
MKAMPRFLMTTLTALAVTGATAGEADVVAAEAHCDAGRRCRFDVTVRHTDEGWAHYADRWDVLAPDGRVLGTRVLLHPHETEQPFTRSLGGVAIPPGIGTVRLRAHDKVHGHGGAEIDVAIP